jgi:hypothetical protein
MSLRQIANSQVQSSLNVGAGGGGGGGGGGVTSLNGITGVMTLSSSNGSLLITPGAGTIDLQTTGGGGGGGGTVTGLLGSGAGSVVTNTASVNIAGQGAVTVTSSAAGGVVISATALAGNARGLVVAEPASGTSNITAKPLGVAVANPLGGVPLLTVAMNLTPGNLYEVRFTANVWELTGVLATNTSISTINLYPYLSATINGAYDTFAGTGLSETPQGALANGSTTFTHTSTGTAVAPGTPFTFTTVLVASDANLYLCCELFQSQTPANTPDAGFGWGGGRMGYSCLAIPLSAP